MKPIQTYYKGYHFRSRLEARWAVFFQTMHVHWVYEAEGYILKNGVWYLPDFLIKLADGPVWCEVKPHGEESPEFEMFMCERPTNERGTVLHDIPDPEDLSVADDNNSFDGYYGGKGCDTNHQFCICPKCDAVGFQYEGRVERVPCGCDFNTGARHHTPGHNRIKTAYAKARAQRFEHGHTGQPC